MINTNESVSARPLLDAQSLQMGRQVTGQLVGAKRGSKKAGERDTDLGHGKEEVRIRGQLGDQLTALTSMRELPDLALPE